LSQFTRLTDGQTDRILIARPRLHSTQRGKNRRTESCSNPFNHQVTPQRPLMLRQLLVGH